MTVAFVAYETPASPCGGIAAVLGRLPRYVREVTGRQAVVISPLHHRVERTAGLIDEMKKIGEVGVPTGRNLTMVDVLRLEQDVPYYFLKPEDPKIFAGQKHPYDIDGPTLLRDSLFYGAAVARALRILAPHEAWSIALQDWEAATVALALASLGGVNAAGEAAAPGGHRLYLTLHNSYDCEVADAELSRVAIDPALCTGRSILERALPLVEHPVFTVSDQFAVDIITDTLQREIMAPHLQRLLGSRLVGVNNGPFIDLSVPRELLADARAGIYEPLRQWKSDQRSAALDALQALVPSAERPVWGDPRRFDVRHAPWFVMAGRDDSRQKGYDVAAGAVEAFLNEGGDGRFLFFPIPGDEGLQGLGFLRRLAERRPEQVIAFPFRFREGFFAAMQGADFGVMPSLYEPFGMAHEFYLNGAVGIGRATGGIVQQIVPWRAAAAHSRAVEARASRWHTSGAPATGVLFREADRIPSASADWQSLNAARYDALGGQPDRVAERLNFPLYASMVDELHLALCDGAHLSRDLPELYVRMLVDGIDLIERTFSWERSAAEYSRSMPAG